MADRDKPPAPIVRLTSSRLVPVSAYDAEELQGYAIGTEFDLVSRTRRSIPQNGTYWKCLQHTVDATGLWPSREALHTALKVRMGHVEPVFDLNGNVVGMQPHSTAFQKMDHKEFRAFMDGALMALSDAVGFDPMGWKYEGA